MIEIIGSISRIESTNPETQLRVGVFSACTLANYFCIMFKSLFVQTQSNTHFRWAVTHSKRTDTF